ncbi:MAG: class II glutamine amidotransferase [Gemmatimonadota bacterium]
MRAVGDEDFGRHVRVTHAAMFLAHVRYADIGEISEANTHPFVLDGRACAHNGVAGYVRLRQGDVTWAPGSHDGADIEVPA